MKFLLLQKKKFRVVQFHEIFASTIITNQLIHYFVHTTNDVKLHNNKENDNITYEDGVDVNKGVG